MGDRLGNFKPFDKTFTMSYFSMILINEQGKIMGHVKQDNTDNFYLSLILEHKDTDLEPGKYTLVVDCLWKKCPALKEFKDVIVRMFTGEVAPITKIDRQQGFTTLFNALSLYA